MQLDIDLAQQAPPNNLPDKSQNQMLPHLNDIPSANVHHRAPYTLRRLNNDVIILRIMKSIQRLELLPGLIQQPLSNGMWHPIVNKLSQHQAILTLIKHLKSVGGE